MDYFEIQDALKRAGFYHSSVDGIYGPLTRLAIIEFKASQGLPSTAFLGQSTLRRLLHPDTKTTPRDIDTPWVNEIGRHLGLHERFNNRELRAWLSADGRTLGDPAVLPWCGDAVQTALALSLPNDRLTGATLSNPYLARNWLEYGEECRAGFGAVVVFYRGRKDGHSGHVGFVMGYDAMTKRILVRGGNQDNRVSDAWLDEKRVLGFRRPVGTTLADVPQYDASGAIVSKSEV